MQNWTRIIGTIFLKKSQFFDFFDQFWPIFGNILWMIDHELRIVDVGGLEKPNFCEKQKNRSDNFCSVLHELLKSCSTAQFHRANRRKLENCTLDHPFNTMTPDPP